MFKYGNILSISSNLIDTHCRFSTFLPGLSEGPRTLPFPARAQQTAQGSQFKYSVSVIVQRSIYHNRTQPTAQCALNGLSVICNIDVCIDARNMFNTAQILEHRSVVPLAMFYRINITTY